MEATKKQDVNADEVESIMDAIDNEKPVDAVPGQLCYFSSALTKLIGSRTCHKISGFIGTHEPMLTRSL